MIEVHVEEKETGTMKRIRPLSQKFEVFLSPRNMTGETYRYSPKRRISRPSTITFLLATNYVHPAFPKLYVCIRVSSPAARQLSISIFSSGNRNTNETFLVPTLHLPFKRRIFLFLINPHFILTLLFQVTSCPFISL